MKKKKVPFMTSLNFSSSPMTKLISNSHLDSDVIMDLSTCGCSLSVSSQASTGKVLTAKSTGKKQPFCLVLEGKRPKKEVDEELLSCLEQWPSRVPWIAFQKENQDK